MEMTAKGPYKDYVGLPTVIIGKPEPFYHAILREAGYHAILFSAYDGKRNKYKKKAQAPST